MKVLNDTEKACVAEWLIGTSQTGAVYVVKYGVSIRQIQEAARENGVERCMGCDYWFDSAEIDDDSGCCHECR